MADETHNPADLDHDGDVDGVDIALAFERYTGPGGTATEDGDQDGDGDIDGEDLARIYAAYTGPLPPQNEIDANDINSDLARHDAVSVPAGSKILGGLRPQRQVCVLTVSGSGPRPLIETRNHGEYGIQHQSQHIERFHVSGFAGRSPFRDTSRFISVRLNGKDDRYAKRVEIIDCKGEDFDTNFEFVDDWPRIKGLPTGEPGRLNLTFGLNISGRAYGSDAHSVGLYYEGLADGASITDSAFDLSGYLNYNERNKKSHSIYGQLCGALVDRMTGCVFSRAAANAVQARSGCNLYRENIASGCALGPWIRMDGRVERSVVLDQVDITDAPQDHRGHGFILTGYRMQVRDCVAARRHGSLGSEPAFKGISEHSTLENNTAVEWAADGSNFEVGGVQYTDTGTNRTIMSDPGVPVFTEISDYINRERGQAYKPTAIFIDKCLEAVA